MPRGLFAFTLAAALVTGTPAALAAQGAAADFPQRPIRLVVPFAAGGATDIVARMLGPKLAERCGQQVVVDNRAGAAGNIAVEIVATAQPDGYTLPVGNISTNSINPILFAKMKVDAIRDLTGVTLLASIPNAILAGPKVPGTTLKEAIAWARVTEADLASHRIIRDALARLAPGIPFLLRRNPRTSISTSARGGRNTGWWTPSTAPRNSSAATANSRSTSR